MKDDLVLVRRDSGGVFPDGTTNHPPIDFAAQAIVTAPVHPYTCGTCPAEFGSRAEYFAHCVQARHDNWQAVQAEYRAVFLDAHGMGD